MKLGGEDGRKFWVLGPLEISFATVRRAWSLIVYRLILIADLIASSQSKLRRFHQPFKNLMSLLQQQVYEINNIVARNSL